MSDPAGEPELRRAFERWLQERAARGRRATMVDLYRLAAAELGRPITAPEKSRLWTLGAPVQFDGFEVLPGTDRAPDRILVVDYDPAWPERFADWRERLAAALGPAALAIEHIGSTSVPGMPAKPIIDIQVSVADPEAEHLYVPAIESTGLQLRSRDRLHRFFRPFPDLPRDVQVHVCEAGGDWERDHLAFRNHLRADAAARRRYESVKRRAAAEYPDDRIGYTDSKTAVILDILEGR